MPEMVSIPGINIQWPWSEYILSGKKDIETRGYPIPQKHLGKPLAVIETPGPRGLKVGITKARITGIVVFRESFLYGNLKQWLDDYQRHRVEPQDHQFGFDPLKAKWGWVVETYRRIEEPLLAPEKKGIVFATSCKVPRRLV